eukprot:TRINITY_DN4526_c0_g1_i6.p2 TRINITY_DN4526_c0_g1~~TRINITY_DN4526_c0_g1_i6.p2  ORF type:complete len:151 (-),score=36.46 TRINITY_DN4526_c0_g1_i6:465-917(-)
MLADPNCDDPANRDCAKLFMTDHDGYLAKAKECAQKSLTEIPEDFVVIPPCDYQPPQNNTEPAAEMMEMSWQGSDGSDDEGIVVFSDGGDSDCFSDDSDNSSSAVNSTSQCQDKPADHVSQTSGAQPSQGTEAKDETSRADRTENACGNS